MNCQPPHLDAPFGLFPVSILKPLKGAENGIKENIRSFFDLDYPHFELLFSIAENSDPAKHLVRELIQQYPHVKAKLIVGQIEAGPNPKVNNLIKSYEAASHDLILISDSNIRVEANYLKRLVAHLDNGVGVITAIVAGRNAETFGGKLESTYLNTFYARWMVLAARFGNPCVVGKSMLFSRKTAERFGGIKTLARYLAEDYMTGVAMLRLGLRVIIMSDPVPQFIGSYPMRDFWSRHLRWGRIRKSQAELAFAIEPLFGCFVSGIAGSWATSQLFDCSWAPVLFLHLVFWCINDLILQMRIGKELSLSAPLMWLTRETLSFPMWLHIALGKTVMWRGRKLVLQPGGLLDPKWGQADA